MQVRARRFWVSAALLPALVVAVVLAVTAPPAHAARGIPVGMFNVNNSVMNSPQYVYALRFVLDQDTTVYRFLSGFNLEGSSGVGGRDGYASGNGGTIRARIVNVNADGTPNLGEVLAQESVNADQRFNESKSAYGVSGLTQLLYFNMGGVRLSANRMYAMVYTNADPNPGSNWFSENSPDVKESVAGPNGRNTTDPNAAGAIAGLDPREVVGWSSNGGSSWVWGRMVGEGNTSGAYVGSASSDDGTRLPWYGIQTSSDTRPVSNQPYYAYTAQGSYTLKLTNAPRQVTLTEAGGYGPSGDGIGVVTVTNTITGETGKTAALAGGLAKGPLDHPVTIRAGDAYTISNTGTVYKQEADEFIQRTFGVGSGRWSFSTDGQGMDVAELFALPHPWYDNAPASTGGGSGSGSGGGGGGGSGSGRRRRKSGGGGSGGGSGGGGGGGSGGSGGGWWRLRRRLGRRVRWRWRRRDQPAASAPAAPAAAAAAPASASASDPALRPTAPACNSACRGRVFPCAQMGTAMLAAPPRVLGPARAGLLLHRSLSAVSSCRRCVPDFLSASFPCSSPRSRWELRPRPRMPGGRSPSACPTSPTR